MSSEEKPPIEISHKRVFCSLHGEPFRERYPRGYPTMMLLLVEAVMKTREGVQLSAQLTGEARDRAIEEFLDAQPACCRVSPLALKAAYIESDVGVVMQCVACEEHELGTPYTTSQGRFGHVCFDCVLFRMEPLN